jgi:ABC-type transport system involved in multi-copper enzyme maturation permease subunit
MYAIVGRELIALLRTPRALALQAGAVLLYTLLVLLRWPSDDLVGLSGVQAQSVFRVFSYGLTTVLLLLAPAFPAASLITERQRGTLALLINSPLGPWSIYLGKLAGVVGFALILLALSLPASAACYAMGGLSLSGHLMLLYAVLLVAALECCALGLLVSSRAGSADSALRVTYGLVLLIALGTMGPYLFLQGKPGRSGQIAEWLRCASPVAAVMEVVGHGDVGSQGVATTAGVARRYLAIGLAMSAAFALATVVRLNYTIFDRSRPPGVITDERPTPQRWARRLFFLVDPQRRKRGIAFFMNAVMVKEFRSRRFGRSHWLMRLAAGCALVSLGLTYAATLGAVDWGPETIGGIMVLLQVALLVVVTPSLAAGLISTERESGAWTLLQMTPLSPGAILRGKLLSVLWPVALILTATLPGYLVMVWIDPRMGPQIWRVLTTLLLAAIYVLVASAAIGSLFRKTAAATTAAYAFVVLQCVGTMLFWLGREAPFGFELVQSVLRWNPLATALSQIRVPGFVEYDLAQANWRRLAWGSVFFLALLAVQTGRLRDADKKA